MIKIDILQHGIYTFAFKEILECDSMIVGVYCYGNQSIVGHFRIVEL